MVAAASVERVRAYIRKDPLTFHHKVVEDGYPIGAYAAFEAMLCIGEGQPLRGRFASEKLLRLLLEEPAVNVRTGLGRWVPYLIAHDDLRRLADGSLEIVGWDGWQEGDVTVKERMARLRKKPSDGGDRNNNPAPVTTDAVNIPSDVSGKRLAVSGKPHNGRADGEELDGIDLFREGLPHLDEETLKLGHEITGKPAREMGDKQLDELDRLLGEHGADRVRSAMRRVPPYEGKLSWQRVVWGARKVLEPLWEGKPETPRERAERDERERREHADAINAQFAKPGVA